MIETLKNKDKLHYLEFYFNYRDILLFNSNLFYNYFLLVTVNIFKKLNFLYCDILLFVTHHNFI